MTIFKRFFITFVSLCFLGHLQAVKEVHPLSDDIQHQFKQVLIQFPEAAKRNVKGKKFKIHGRKFSEDEFASLQIQHYWRYLSEDYIQVWKDYHPVKKEQMSENYRIQKAYLQRAFAATRLASLLGRSGYTPSDIDFNIFRTSIVGGLEEICYGWNRPQNFFVSWNPGQNEKEDRALYEYIRHAWTYRGILLGDVYQQNLYPSTPAPLKESWDSFVEAEKANKHPSLGKVNFKKNKKFLIFKARLLTLGYIPEGTDHVKARQLAQELLDKYDGRKRAQGAATGEEGEYNEEEMDELQALLDQEDENREEEEESPLAAPAPHVEPEENFEKKEAQSNDPHKGEEFNQMLAEVREALEGEPEELGGPATVALSKGELDEDEEDGSGHSPGNGGEEDGGAHDDEGGAGEGFHGSSGGSPGAPFEEEDPGQEEREEEEDGRGHSPGNGGEEDMNHEDSRGTLREKETEEPQPMEEGSDEKELPHKGKNRRVIDSESEGEGDKAPSQLKRKNKRAILSEDEADTEPSGKKPEEQKKKRKYTSPAEMRERERQITELYQTDTRCIDIALQLSLTQSDVGKIISKLGLAHTAEKEKEKADKARALAERNAEILRLYREGKSTKEIAGIVPNTTKAAADSVVSKSRAPTKKADSNPRRRTAEERAQLKKRDEEIARLYEQEKGPKVIAEELQVSKRTVEGVIIRQGLARTEEKEKEEEAIAREKRNARILKLHGEGKGPKEISETLKTTTDIVQNFLRKQGLTKKVEPKFSKAELAEKKKEVVRLYEKLKDTKVAFYQDIADKTGLTYRQVHGAIQEHRAKSTLPPQEG